MANPFEDLDDPYRQVNFNSDNDGKMNRFREFLSSIDEDHVGAEEQALASGVWTDERFAHQILVSSNHAVGTLEEGSALAATPAEAMQNGAAQQPDMSSGQPAVSAPNQPAPDAAATAANDGGAGQGAASAASGNAAAPREATATEKKFASIRLDGERQNRVVMLGDPVVEQRMYQMLEAQGKVGYVGGVPHINATTNQIVKAYNDAATELTKFAGPTGKQYETFQALEMTLNREPSGFLGSLGAKVNNFIGNQHTVTVLVGGDKAARDKAMASLSQFVNDMHKQSFIKSDDVSKFENKEGKLEWPVGDNGKPSALKVESTSTLDSAVALAAMPVREREAYVRELEVWDKNRQTEKRASDRAEGKKPDAEKDAKSKTEQVKVNEHAKGIIEHLDKAVSNPSELMEQNKRGQVNSEALLLSVRHLRDPLQPEFGTLPDAQRQKALVQLDALAAKALNNEFNKETREAVSSTPNGGGLSFAGKLEKLHEAELARDPEFASKAAGYAKELVAAGFITEQQASSLPSVRGVTGAEVASTTSTSAEPKATTMATVVDAPQGISHADIARVAKAGPDGMSGDEMDKFMSRLLDARDKGDFKQIDPRGADTKDFEEPTKTIARIDVLVDAIQQHRKGSQAGDEAGFFKDVQEQNNHDWHANDLARYQAAGRTQEDHARVMAEARAEMGSWSAGPTAQPSSASTSATESVTQGQPTASTQPIVNMQATEKAITQLLQLMANPAGNFTTKDHLWDPRGAEKLAKAINGIDSDALAQLPPATRAEVAAYAEWAGKAAETGKLPLNDDIRAGLAISTEQLKQFKGDAPLGEDALKQLAKAQRLESAMDTRAHSSGASRNDGFTPDANRDMSNIAKDLVHAVYKAPEMGEAYAKYTLKMASTITPDNIKSLPPDERARTAVALDFLAKQVKEGALGDFGTLSNAVQRHTDNALAAADKMYQAYARDPSMQTAMIRAENDLRSRGEPAASTSHDVGVKEAKEVKEAKQPAAERAMER